MSESIGAKRPAVQYLRMSTEHQRYALDNQRQIIGEYARANGYDIIATYADAGRSGLTLEGREGLNRLLRDVTDPDRAFSAILVLDISRWGRFQDVDQSAAYEFLCADMGVRIEYVGERIPEGNGFATSMLKHMKRVMAAEYSRDLSDRVSYAQVRSARRGEKQGGPAAFGLRRLLTDGSGRAKRVLAGGERKALASDRVRIVPGPSDEQAVVRRIFDLFVGGATICGIARHLNAAGVAGAGGSPWAFAKVKKLLTNELYIGVYVYNRRSAKLKSTSVANPQSHWVRVRVFEPIVPVDTFRKAQARFATERRGEGNRYDPNKMLDGLKALLEREGRLSAALINACPTTPNVSTYRRAFGGLGNAYARIGYRPQATSLERPPKLAQRGPFTRSALRAQLRRALARYGYLSAGIIKRCAFTASVDTYRRVFGSLVEAYRAAGFDGPRRAPVKNGLYDEADALARLKALYERHGDIRRATLSQDRTMPGARWYARRYGSFAAACERAGIDYANRTGTGTARALDAYLSYPDGGAPPRPAKPDHLPDEAVFGAVRRLYETHGFVNRDLLRADPGLPSLWRLMKRYASVEHLYAAAGLALDPALVRRRATREKRNRIADPVQALARTGR